jgi:hypothetical protein
MELSLSEARGRVPVTVIHVKGSLTTEEVLQAAARQAFDGGTRNILLDLSDVPFMASAGLRALHEIYTLLRTNAPEESDDAVRRGIAAGTFTSPHFKLLKPNRNVFEVLKVAGYDMFLEIHTDLKRAVASF